MLKKNNFTLIFGTLLVAFIGLLVYLEIYFVAAIIPVALIITGIAIFRLNWLLYIIVFLTPLSVNLEELQFGLGIALPTEPLMFGAMLVFYAKLFFDHRFDKGILYHPVTLAIILHLLWIGITAITSEMPIVSIKFLISRLWFVTVGFFIATKVFKNIENIHRLLWLYIIPLAIVIVYTLIQHAIRGFEEKPAHWVMQPFFKDHTSYGALVAFYIPVIIGYLFNPNFRWNLKFITFFVLLVFLVGVIFSYTRAAWLSLGAALAVFIFIKFKIKWYYLAAIALVGGGLFFTLKEDIIIKLEKNKQDSSGDFAEHVQSMSNVASDASNLERINRWNCAFRMFNDRPVFGYGPGTYMFLYAPFQHSSELTIISTNFGDGGNAHSEYFGPLAEQGVLGLFNLLLLLFLVFFKAIPLYYKLQNNDLKVLTLSAILALVTYFTHGVLNNYLDLDKASIPVFSFMAMLVAIEVYHLKKPASTISKE